MYEQVRTQIVEMIDLLESDSSSWVKLFRKALLAFDAQDFDHCAYIILSGSGGMGSLNDLVLGQSQDEKGQFIWKDGYVEMNEKFASLLGQLYGFSRSYQRAISKRS
jgi:hypothetical protein